LGITITTNLPDAQEMMQDIINNSLQNPRYLLQFFCHSS
jgi:hypothetical protein